MCFPLPEPILPRRLRAVPLREYSAVGILAYFTAACGSDSVGLTCARISSFDRDIAATDAVRVAASEPYLSHLAPIAAVREYSESQIPEAPTQALRADSVRADSVRSQQQRCVRAQPNAVSAATVGSSALQYPLHRQSSAEQRNSSVTNAGRPSHFALHLLSRI